jgi:hypothetical protein
VVLVTVDQTELAECDEETPASFGMDVEVSGQLVRCSRATAERIEQAEINGSKEDLGVNVRESHLPEATGRF